MRSSVERLPHGEIPYVGRVHPDDHQGMGDPYVGLYTMTQNSDGVATIRGFMLQGLDRAMWETLRTKLTSLGISKQDIDEIHSIVRPYRLRDAWRAIETEFARLGIRPSAWTRGYGERSQPRSWNVRPNINTGDQT